LNRRANQLAHALRRRGIGRGSLVGLLLPRSPELIVALIGILKAGGAYLPLDPAAPRERLALMLDDAQAQVVVTVTELTGGVSGSGAWVICLDRDGEAIGRESEGEPSPLGTGEDLAYVIYTSGSTGRPKGVMVAHRSVLNLWTGLKRAIYEGAGEGLRVSLNAPVSFDASVQQWVMLLSGHTVCVVPQEARLDGKALREWMAQVRLDVLDCVPTQLRLLIGAGLLEAEGYRPRIVLPGGEAIDEELWERLLGAEGIEFYNMYGPTECTVDVTAFRVKEGREGPRIGGPLCGTAFYVVDGQGELVPEGVGGELWIGGEGVAVGYWKRPELSKEKFVADRFRGEGRVYRTGDRVRWREEGRLEYLGRTDQQVKVRGFRIELGEIEAALGSHPALRAVAVIAREDRPGDKRLVAYVVPDGEGDSLPVGELRRFLGESLPDYMVPSAFVVLASLPLLPNGKIDRKALPVPDLDRPEMETAYVAAGNRTEEQLAAIWAEVLGVERVGVHDNFFELGGDSILSIQVIARANQAGLRLTPRQLFEYPTVAGLAAAAQSGRVVHAEQGLVLGEVPLTPIQRWFFDLDLANPRHWNQSLLLEVSQPLDPEFLREAVSHLTAHHDVLRTRFEVLDRGVRAVSVGPRATPFAWIDLSQLPEAEIPSGVERWAGELQASLDLSAGPLLWVAYFHLGEAFAHDVRSGTAPHGDGTRRSGRDLSGDIRKGGGRLLIAVHHLAIDAFSWPILLADLQSAYESLSRGETVALPPKTTSYRHWAERLAAHAGSDECRLEREFWLEVAGSTFARLPVDSEEGENTEASAESIEVALTPEETQALLRDVPAVYRTQINDVLLAALARALARWTGSPVARVDLEGHGREDLFDDVDLSRTVGWFTSLFPVRLDLNGHETLVETLMAVKEQLRRIPRRGIGYGLLLGDPEDDDRLSRLPRSEVVFNYLGQTDKSEASASLPELPFRPATESKGPERSPAGKRPHLIDINGSVSGGALQMEWTYSANRHRRETILGVAGDFIDQLRALIAHCQSPECGEAARGAYTASDFEEFAWNQTDLNDILAAIGDSFAEESSHE
jgi:amino acid adenylation domain-containing protein/non-ribosomal peptide synthase protein (TIGR01720 family)